jgi:hypothetical protein
MVPIRSKIHWGKHNKLKKNFIEKEKKLLKHESINLSEVEVRLN